MGHTNRTSFLTQGGGDVMLTADSIGMIKKASKYSALPG